MCKFYEQSGPRALEDATRTVRVRQNRGELHSEMPPGDLSSSSSVSVGYAGFFEISKKSGKILSKTKGDAPGAGAAASSRGFKVRPGKKLVMFMC